MQNPHTLEEDILNALIDNKCKNVLLIFKLIKRHIQEEKRIIDKENYYLKLKYYKLETMYNQVLEIKKGL